MAIPVFPAESPTCTPGQAKVEAWIPLVFGFARRCASSRQLASESPMAALYRQAMDWLYLVCVCSAGTALVLISAVIPWAVYTRYVLNSAASGPNRPRCCSPSC